MAIRSRPEGANATEPGYPRITTRVMGGTVTAVVTAKPRGQREPSSSRSSASTTNAIAGTTSDHPQPVRNERTALVAKGHSKRGAQITVPHESERDPQTSASDDE